MSVLIIIATLDYFGEGSQRRHGHGHVFKEKKTLFISEKFKIV